MVMAYSGGGASKRWVRQAFELFSDMDPDLVGDWDYTRTPFKYRLSLSNDQFLRFASSGLLNGGVIVLVEQAPRQRKLSASRIEGYARSLPTRRPTIKAGGGTDLSGWITITSA
jgi:hypothetical protein